jgi:Mrp family chromosome partitioning ATPase/capsular polysaccharide biosynthesis protein
MAGDPRRAAVAEFTVPDFDASPEESSLGAYLRAIRAHRVLVAIVLLAAAGASILWLSVRSPTYRSTAELLVTPLPLAQDQQGLFGLALLRESGDATRTMQTAAALVDSREAASAAARRLGDGWTAGRVQRAVDVKPEGQANILDIVATADDAALAARVANTFARSVLDVRRRLLHDMASKAVADLRARLTSVQPPDGPVAQSLQGRLSELQALAAGDDPTLSMSQPGQLPTSPLGPRPWQVIALALMAGLVLGTGSALLINLLPLNLISTEEDLLHVWPLPVIARVPKLPRGRQMYPRIDPRAWEAFRTVRRQLELPGQRRGVVVFTSPSRGDGKTTGAVTFATVLAQRGSEVILVEADAHKPDLRRVLGLDPRPQAVPVGASDIAPTDALVPIPGLESVRLMEVVDGDTDLGTRQVARAINEASGAADYVVIDTPPLGEVSDALPLLAELGESDSVIVMVRLENTKRSDARTTRDLLARAGVTPAGFMLLGSHDAARAYPYGR